MSTNSSKTSGFSGLLTIVFIILKLTNVIDWKWIWILSPMWIGFLLTILIAFIFFDEEFYNNR
jgi:hypothetical protein